MEKFKEIERSIITTYRHSIWRKFVKAVEEFDMISQGDSIAVCISGGKDSFLLAKLMQEYQAHSKKQFNLHFIVMNPGYNMENAKLIEQNSKIMNVPIDVFNSPIFESVEKVQSNACYICAKMRRGYLYKKAQSLGCNKIALGHHFNDVIETTLLSMLYSAQLQGMPPKLNSTSHKGMQLIRPLYYVNERHIINWKKHNNLQFLQCACKVAKKNNSSDLQNSKRQEIKLLIEELKKINPNVDMNIFRSSYNVFLDTFIGYKQNGKNYSFKDKFKSLNDDGDGENNG